MKYLLILLALATSATAQTTRHETTTSYAIAHPQKPAPREAQVYICNSPNAKRYHATQGCSGFQKCTHSTSLVAIGEAQSLGLTPCKICY